ncbi:MAG: helix-turn-helix domain-containing protein [Pirellulales bacterium]
MAQRFVSLEEAAQRLGVTKERLNGLREAGDARAFRDGKSWKFKEEEVERLAAAGTLTPDGETSSESGLQLDADLEEDLKLSDDSESILLSEAELDQEQPEAASSSTIIGEDNLEGDADSDLKIDDEDTEDLAVSDSEIKLSDEPGEEGDISLDASNVLSTGEGGSGVLDQQEDSVGAQFEDLEELDIDLEIASSQVGLEGAPLVEAEPPKQDPTASDSVGLNMGESSIKLANDDDDDIVLGEEPSSDITLASQQSGISLVDAADTGISLDEDPSDLGTGSSVGAIDLGDEGSFTLSDSMAGNAVLDDEEIVLGSGPGSSPKGASESGSQVMAFDLEGEIDENTATILGAESALGSGSGVAGEATAPMLEEEVENTGLGAVGATAPMAGAAAPAVLREAQYSTWNIAFLVLCTLLLSLAGVMMVDLLRSMWSWNEPFELNSSLMDMLLDALP